MLKMKNTKNLESLVDKINEIYNLALSNIEILID